VVHSKWLGLLDNPGPVPLSQLTDGQFRPSTQGNFVEVLNMPPGNEAMSGLRRSSGMYCDLIKYEDVFIMNEQLWDRIEVLEWVK
jgi:hypothetical protein